MDRNGAPAARGDVELLTVCGKPPDSGTPIVDDTHGWKVPECVPSAAVPRSAGGVGSWARVAAANTEVAARYVVSSTRKSKRAFLIGLATVGVVVLFIALLQNAISHAPVVFMKLAEDTVGEYDLLMTPAVFDLGTPSSSYTTNPSPASASWSSGSSYESSSSSLGVDWPPWASNESAMFPELGNVTEAFLDGLFGSTVYREISSYFLNWTELRPKIQAQPAALGSVPRWILYGSVRPARQGDEEQSGSSDSSSGTSASSSSSEGVKGPSASAVLLVINSRLEDELGLGREWNHPALLPNHTYASSALLRRLGLEDPVEGGPDVSVDVVIDFLVLFQTMAAGGSISSTAGAGSGGSRQDEISQIIASAIGVPLSGNWSFNVTLDPTTAQALQALLNLTSRNVTIEGANATVVVQNYVALLELLAPFGVQLPPVNSTAFQDALRTINGTTTLTLNASSFLPPGLEIGFGDNGTVTVSLSYDLRPDLYAAAKDVSDALVFDRTYRVAAGIGNPNGKFPSALGNVVIFESDDFEVQLRAFLDNAAKPIQALAGRMAGQLLQLEAQLRNATAFDPFNGTSLWPFNLTSPNVTAGQDLLLNRTLLNSAHALMDFANATGLFQSVALSSHAMTVVVQIKEREKTYSLSSSDLDAAMLRFSAAVSESIGFNASVRYATPVKTAMATYQFFRLFLDQLFNFTLVVMLFLGAMLIFSLLLSDVESKTYEYGMLRALGMRHPVLIELLSMQSLLFALPAIFVGLLLGWAIYTPVAAYIAYFVALPIDLSLGWKAAVLAAGLGLLMPAVSNIVPIQRALSNTLRDALDVYHQVSSEIKVRVTKLENLGISPLFVVLSILIIVIGFVSYYVVPYSFIFSNLALFFTVLIAILLGFLVGLSLIGHAFQPWLQMGLLFAIIWGPSAGALRTLVRKNLSAHGRRNNKTTIMLTTALSFIVFAGATFSLLGGSMVALVRFIAAADIAVYAPSLSAPLDRNSFETFLKQETNRSGTIVRDYTFITFPLDHFNWVRDTRISNLASFPFTRVVVTGLERNFLRTCFDEFFEAQETFDFSYNETSAGTPDVVDSLYAHKGHQLLPIERTGISIPVPVVSEAPPWLSESTNNTYTSYVDVLVSEALREQCSVDTSTAMAMRTRFRLRNTTILGDLYYLVKARAMVNRLPGFLFSSFRSMAIESPVLVTTDSYMMLLRHSHYAAQTSDELPTAPPMQRLLIRVQEKSTSRQREELVNALQNYIDDDSISVFEVKKLVQSSSQAITLLNVFFAVVSAIAGALCFFMLWLSFAANVRENSWEFAVLRSVGLTANQVISLYIYEAVSLVLSSVIVGTLVGIPVAILLTAQFDLFTTLPFTFSFPYTLYFSVVFVSILLALVGSFIPAAAIRKKPIGAVLKGM